MIDLGKIGHPAPNLRFRLGRWIARPWGSLTGLVHRQLHLLTDSRIREQLLATELLTSGSFKSAFLPRN
jgi:hypothetical protein